MSHVDEGALHAYLDGALDEYPAAEAARVRDHLESCGPCAIRLEAARRTQQAANSILGLAVPDVEAPSFEELRAYVQATRPPTTRRSVRLYRMGWAASVILALGAGWMVGGGQLQTVPAANSARTDVIPAAELDGAAAERSESNLADRGVSNGVTDEGEALPPAGRQAVVGGAAASDVLKLGDETVEVAAEEELQRRAPAAAEAAAGAFADADVARDLRVMDDEAAQVQVAAGGLADSIGRRANEAESIAPGGGGVGATEAAPTLVAALPVDRLGGASALAAGSPAAPVSADSAAPRAQAERRRVAERLEQTASRLDVAVTPLPEVVALQDAVEPEIDEAPLAVPGVEVVSYAQLTEGTTPGGVHIVQRLDDGEILDVYHLPVGVAPSALPPLEASRSEVSSERAGHWVVLRAARPAAELEVLLERLLPQG